MESLTASINEAEERISDIEDQMTENKEAEQKRDKQLEDHLGRIREISDIIRQNNIRIIGIPEEEERESAAEGISERIIVENFPNMAKGSTHQNPGGIENPPSKSIRIGPHPVI